MLFSWCLIPSRPSTLRKKLQDSISDPKYDGVRITRKQFLDDSNQDDDPSDASEDDEQAGNSAENPSELSSDEERNVSEQGDHSVENLSESSNDEEENISERPDQAMDSSVDLSSTSRKTQEEDLRKGKTIARQIVRLSTSFPCSLH